MMATTQEPKVVHQLRRARRLAELLATAYPQPEWALNAAELLNAKGWAIAAGCIDITPPSDDTVALTIELLRERTET